MPYLTIQTNITLDPELTMELGRKASAWVAEQLGKSEAYVMTLIGSQQTMSFAGNNDPCAFVELKSLGLATEQTAGLCEGLCELLHTEISIDPARVYIEFSSPPRPFWGWNGKTF